MSDPELIKVRHDEQISSPQLLPYLRKHLPKTKGDFSILQFGGGHANLTYRIKFGENEYVLRRPPLGPIVRSSHDMVREHKVLSLLHKHFPLAPFSYHLCEDMSVIGAKFHVMERRRGIVIRSDLFAPFIDDNQMAQRIGNSIIKTLGNLHKLNPISVGLGTLGHPEGYLERQVNGWIGRWESSLTEPIPGTNWLIRWLIDNKPPQREGTLIHNDFKLDNIMVNARNPAKFVAVLDWDMCTRGDPLCDLGYLLNWWGEPGDDNSWLEAGSLPSWRPGFPSRAQITKQYFEHTGVDPIDIQWYHVFGTFRLAVIIQQIYVRFLRGQTQDHRFTDFRERVSILIKKSQKLASA